MLRLIGSLFTLLIIILFVFFTSRNPGNVQIDFYFGLTQVPLAMLVISCLFVGSLVGIFISFALILRTRRKMAKLKRQMKATEQEVNNLRTLPIRDSH
jgi:putative membrane protein